MISAIRYVLLDEEGQGLAEYGLVVSLIAVVCVAAVAFLGGNIQAILSSIGSEI